MGADYHFHPIGTLPGDKAPEPKVHTITDKVFRAMNEEAIKIQEELALVKQQLENTEKVYDRALQENIRLQDENARLKDSEAIDEEIINTLDEMLEPVHVHLSGNESVESVRAGSLSKTTISPTPPRPEMSGGYAADMIIINDPLAPHRNPEVLDALEHKAEIHAEALKKIRPLSNRVEQPSADAKLNDELQKAYETIVLLMNLRDWGAATGALLGDGVVKKAYRSVDPNDHRPMIQKWQSKKSDEQPVGTAVTSAKAGEPVQLSLGATRTAHDELQIAEIKVALAQGDAAKVKQTLTQTQKACRRYKARIERQKVQLEALQTLADKAFPLYEILLSLDSPRTLTEVTAACIDFHNAFNEAAEALTPEDRHER